MKEHGTALHGSGEYGGRQENHAKNITRPCAKSTNEDAPMWHYHINHIHDSPHNLSDYLELSGKEYVLFEREEKNTPQHTPFLKEVIQNIKCNAHLLQKIFI